MVAASKVGHPAVVVVAKVLGSAGADVPDVVHALLGLVVPGGQAGWSVSAPAWAWCEGFLSGNGRRNANIEIKFRVLLVHLRTICHAYRDQRQGQS